MFMEDTSKLDDPRAEASEYSLHSYSDVLESLRDYLRLQGYHLDPAAGGKWCGYDLFKATKPDIPGMTFDPEFRYLRRMDPSSSQDRKLFYGKLEVWAIARLTEHEGDRQAQGYYRAVHTCFKDKLQDPRSPVFSVAWGYQGNENKTVVSLDCKPYGPLPHKYIPPVEAFPPQLQDYDASRLLTLFPEAEREFLLGLLGRVAIGPRGQMTTAGPVSHRYRSAAIAVGPKAGLGKSSLLEFIERAVLGLGYSVSYVNVNPGNKFGWRQVAESDIALVDDLTQQTQHALFHGHHFKSLISGGKFQTEEKGQPSVETQSRTVVLGCSNHSSYSDFIGLDSGVISRLNQLSTFNEPELQRHWGTDRDYRLLQFWEEEAKRLNVDKSLLGYRLMREALDFFMATRGDQIVDQHLVLGSDDRLQGFVERCRKKYRISTNLRHAEELGEVTAKMVAIAVATARKDERDEVRTKGPQMTLSAELLLEVLRYQMSSDSDFPELHLSLMSKGVYPYLSAKWKALECLRQTKSASEAFRTVTQELQSVHSFGYPGSPGLYPWTDEMNQLTSYVEAYDSVDSRDFSDGLQTAVSNIRKLIKAS